MEEENNVNGETLIDGFSGTSSTPALWNSRRRRRRLVVPVNSTDEAVGGSGGDKSQDKQEESSADEKQQEVNTSPPILSEKRKALFEPLEPATNLNGKRPSAESLLPPPDFESASYPKGWLIGKKRKLVNVDVVESMRRIAVQEMNRKDREIDGLNEQLEADAQCLEHLQLQLLEERSKRADVERENTMLQNQITMLMDMMQENEDADMLQGNEQGSQDETQGL